MASVLPERQSVNGRAALNQMFEEAYRNIEQVIAQRLMLWLETALTTLLGREPHERRAHVRHWVEQNGECAKCHSHESWNASTALSVSGSQLPMNTTCSLCHRRRRFLAADAWPPFDMRRRPMKLGLQVVAFN